MLSENRDIDADLDAAFSQLEKKHDDLQESYEKLAKEKEEQTEVFSRKDAEISQLTNDLEAATASIHSLQNDLNVKSKQLTESGEAEAAARDAAERRGREVDLLRAELQAQSDHLASTQGRLSTALQDLAEAQDRVAPLQYANDKFRKEKEALETHSKWISSELNARSAELLSTKKKLSAETFELKSQMESLTAVNESMTQESKLLRDQIRERDTKLSENSSRILELESTLACSQERFEMEVAALKKICSLHQQNTEEAMERVKELEQVTEDQAKALADAASTARDSMAKQKKQAEELLEKARDEAQEKLDALAKELEMAKEAAQAPGAVGLGGQGGPSGSALMGDGVMSLTEMYDKVVCTEQELAREKAERRRVELYLNRILQQMEQKMPKMAGQQRDYRRALQSQELMQDRLQQAMREMDKLQADLIRTEENRNELATENKELKQSVSDLSRQVQLLLKAENEASALLRSQGRKLGSPGAAARIPSEGEAMDSDQVISDYLVTFSSIQELQTRNHQLLQVVRRLSEEKELAVAEELEKKASLDGRQLKQYLAELEAMKEEREGQEEMIQAIIQQRDMYRTLLAQADSEYASPEGKRRKHNSETPKRGSPLALLPAPEPTPSVEEEALKKKVQYLEKEITQLQELLAKSRDAERATADVLATAREDASKARAEAARQAAEAKFHQERGEQLSVAGAEARAEVDRGAAARAQLQALLVAHQRQAADREAEFSALDDENRKLMGALKNAEMEKELARSAESRLAEEVSGLRAEASRQAQLLEGIQRIEAGLTAKGAEQRALLEGEVTRLQKAAELTHKEWRDRLTLAEQKSLSLQKETKAAREKYDQVSAQLAKLKSEKAVLETQLHATQEAEKVAEKNATGLQAQLDKLLVSGSAAATAMQTAAEQELQLNNAQAEIEALKTDLEAARKHSAQYQAIASSHEAALKELGESSEKRKAALAIELEDAQQLAANLQEQAREKQEKFLELMSEAEDLRTTLSKQAEDHKGQLVERELALEKLRADLAALKPRENAFIADREAFKEQARQAQANYDRELQLHAEAAAKARSEESKNLVLQQEIALLKAELAEAQERNNDVEATYKQQISGLQKDKDLIKQEKATISAQNEALHKQLDALSKQVEESMAQKTEKALSAGMGEHGQEEGKGDNDGLRDQVANLREVVRYLRREKEMADARVELLELASVRHEAAAEQAERELESARQKLKEVEGGSSSSSNPTRTLEKDADAMAAIEQQNLLRESNALLRSEHDKIQANAKKLEKDLKNAQKELVPLREAQRKWDATQAALEGDKAALEKECASWKARLASLVSKYNQIDPVEHKKAVEQVAKLTKEVSAAEAASEKLRKDLSSAQGTIIKMQKSLQGSSSDKQSLKTMMSMVERLKVQLSTRNKDLLDATSQIADKDKTIASLTKSKEKQIEDLKKEKEEALQRVQKEKNEALAKAKKEKDEALQKVEVAASGKAGKQVAELESKVQEQNDEIQRLSTSLDKLRGVLRAYKSKMIESKQAKQAPPTSSAPTPTSKAEDSSTPAILSAPAAPSIGPQDQVGGQQVLLSAEEEIRKKAMESMKLKRKLAALGEPQPASKPRLEIDQAPSSSSEIQLLESASASFAATAPSEAPPAQSKTTVTEIPGVSAGSGIPQSNATLTTTKPLSPAATPFAPNNPGTTPIFGMPSKPAPPGGPAQEKVSIFGSATGAGGTGFLAGLKSSAALSFGSSSSSDKPLGSVVFGQGSTPGADARSGAPIFGSSISPPTFGSAMGSSPLKFGQGSGSPLTGFGFGKSATTASATPLDATTTVNDPPKESQDTPAKAPPQPDLQTQAPSLSAIKEDGEIEESEDGEVKESPVSAKPPLPMQSSKPAGLTPTPTRADPATTASSPFLNLQPPSPAGAKGITLQFGRKPSLSLPVPVGSKSPAEGSPSAKPWLSAFAMPAASKPPVSTSPKDAEKKPLFSSASAPAVQAAAGSNTTADAAAGAGGGSEVATIKIPEDMTFAQRIKLREQRFKKPQEQAVRESPDKKAAQSTDANDEANQLEDEKKQEGKASSEDSFAI